jgi:hypothetical protein
MSRGRFLSASGECAVVTLVGLVVFCIGWWLL